MTPMNDLQKNPEHWQLVDNQLYRQFVFTNFIQAFSFMAAVALLAEKANHHPDWSNSYKTVDIYLTSHDKGSIVTAKDINLAEQINQLKL